ncbi:efflux RND transporter permease subunit [Silanimonas sp.]|uniref:efflux RND transporter permease subunit n=1 Tax=Silanimonas sp. TaxID=1929290 RepID=UPI0022C70600|nr:efflux RND transporter permease subunit [Silanimonas sp.]MCZ8062938.1 efflux RND transporter permease subunit [Silanimonas sp.]
MSLIELATRRRVTVAMATVTLVLFGFIALFDLKVNLLPDLSYPTLTVRTEYVGAAPAEIETLVSEPIEQAVGVVKNLRKLKSVSRTGQSDVVLEFAWGTDMDQASLEVRDKLELLQLPLEVKPPVLLRFNPSTQPIMRLAIAASSAQATPQELMNLRRYAEETLKRRLEPVPGVAAVKVGGGLEDEVQVLIDQNKLAQLNLDINVVVQRLQQENVNVSGGRIEEGSQRYLVRTVNQFANLQQMRDMLITTLNGVPIHLRDVATVEQGNKEREAIIRIGSAEAVEVALYKEGDANTVAVADAIKQALRDMERETAPRTPGAEGGRSGPPQVATVPGQYTVDGLTMRTVEDQSVFIGSALSEVQKEAVMGGLFAILIIFFFLRDGWSTFVISLSLPVSIIATFFFMGQLDLSLNVMSLAGLALATGMVVDDSIVVLENIAKAREKGLGVLEAAIVGTKEVGMPVVATTLTTVAVFLPLVFVEGVAGQLFRDQALTVSIALLISMVIALTLIPMLSSLKATAPMSFPVESEPGSVRPPRSFFEAGERFGAPYASMVARRPGALGAIIGVLAALVFAPFKLLWWILSFLTLLAVRAALLVWRGFTTFVLPGVAKVGEFVLRPYDAAAESYRRRILPAALRKPALVLGSAGVAFLLSLGMATTLGTDLIPQLAQDRFDMTAKLPAGTQLQDTDRLVAAVQGQFDGDDRIKALFGVSGTGTRLDANPTESGENIARVSIVLGQGYSRTTEAALTDDLRGFMAGYPDVEVKFSRPELVSLSTPLEIEIRGTDLVELEAAGRKLTDLMKASPHFADVKSTVEQGFPEVQIRFDQERAAALGLTTRQIADEVVRKVRGEVATRYSFRDRKIDVLVRAQESDRASVAEIRDLIINPQSERPVPLSAVAEVVETIGPGEINRVDQTRVAIISANLRDIDLGTAVEEVNKLVEANPLGTDLRLAFGGQSEELGRSLQSLMFAFGLAIFLVYLVMASQFESLLHPFVILFTIPLAVVGAVLALVLSGSPVSVVVFIGLILLVGIVVKNAIVLVDKVNQLRLEGLSKVDALVEGSYSRLRPIVMTTLTTLFGFAPLAFFGGDGAEVKAPMAITVIGGLTVSTLLTLVVIPVMYKLLDRSSDESWKAEGERNKQIGLIGKLVGESQP